jgi:hypothetical protein
MICKNCGAHFDGNFCSNCGEKKYNRHDMSVKHFFEETLESFLHFDNKFLRSVKTILFKPGQLSVAYTEGKRVSFMRPLQLFLIINIFLFIIPANPLSLTLGNYTSFTPFTNYHTKEIVEREVKEKKTTLVAYTNTFNEKIKAESKAFVFLYIPFYALVFWILFFVYRKNFTEHLVFASHFMSFYMLLTIANFLLVIMPFFLIAHSSFSADLDFVDSSVMQLLIAVYLFFAARKFYKSNTVWSAAVGLFIGYFFYTVMQYYRMFLFFKIVHG